MYLPTGCDPSQAAAILSRAARCSVKSSRGGVIAGSLGSPASHRLRKVRRVSSGQVSRLRILISFAAWTSRSSRSAHRRRSGSMPLTYHAGSGVGDLRPVAREVGVSHLGVLLGVALRADRGGRRAHDVPRPRILEVRAARAVAGLALDVPKPQVCDRAVASRLAIAGDVAGVAPRHALAALCEEG